MRFDDDSLDRAILAQQLEEPPADLRASILAATAYRVPPPFTLAEIVAAFCVAGLAVWAAIAAGPVIGGAVATAFSHVALALWLGVGVGVTITAELFTVSQPVFAAARRAKGRAGP